ncbi:response regulator [Methylobacterium sp. NEAU 140]|uniref:response regulator n=1 Tax=Methylobacterium sp. NEAU 140 TaxID=3064945 RepID=UPI002736601C|nr:response regulator [Methylobacterium sp. NEAU 140]MDP4027280.1 response regulator [Methylobacterium sp. NEAU 140]
MNGPPLRVLLVEDEALILMQLEALVEDAGHVVVGTAMRRDEAIGLAQALHPDLALVDLSLCEGGSGLDVAQTLRGMAGTMVVFVTANPMRLDDDLGGAAGVIAKPFTRAVVAGGMLYLEECLRRPPPVSLLPRGMRMAPEFRAS